MSTFPNMAELLTPAVRGCAAIEHYEVTKFDAMVATMHGMYTESGKVALLKVHGKTVMSNTAHEERSNLEVVWRSSGHVLIAGLGMGMILHPMLDKPDISTLTVVEKYQDVIDLIQPTLPHQEKLTLICADIFEWQPLKGQKWDTIYFDIWSDMCTDNLEQIKKLHQRFKSHKTKGGWMASWCQDELRDHKRRYGW